MIRYLAITIGCFLTFSSTVLAQGNTQQEDLYQKEIVWGINKNTNGGHIGGVNLLFKNRKSPNWMQTFGVELANVKHPQENKGGTRSGGSFIVGKTHYLYAARASYGVERILSKKEPQQGIQIAALLSGGPTIGLHAPYYIETIEYQTRPAVADENLNDIFGTGRPLQGIFESDVVPGLHVRTGLNFEYGTFRSNVSGLEIGAMLEIFTKTIVLVPLAPKPARSIFPSFYATLYFGSRR